jgi:hypothetical protein
MNKFIKGIIEETFKSKKQQRLFYAKANDTSLPKKERKKWGKWAQEFSSKTDFDEIPDKVEKEVDEVVDNAGNISMNKRPKNFNTKGITSKSTSDEIVKTGAGSMGTHGVHGTHTSLRYWAESDMSKALGYKDTLGQDEDYEEAKDHFEDDLGLDDNEAKERMAQMGYDSKLPDDKVRLVENPKKFVEEYIESLLRDKTNLDDLVSKNENEGEEKEVNPIIKKQIKSLKNSMDSNNLSINDIIKLLKNNE